MFLQFTNSIPDAVNAMDAAEASIKEELGTQDDKNMSLNQKGQQFHSKLLLGNQLNKSIMQLILILFLAITSNEIANIEGTDNNDKELAGIYSRLKV